ARRAEHLARPAVTRRTELSAPLSLACRAAVRAAAGWIVEAATGVVLLLADGEDKCLTAITAGPRPISGPAAGPHVEGPPLARRSSCLGSVAISGTGSSVGQVNVLCHTRVAGSPLARLRASLCGLARAIMFRPRRCDCCLEAASAWLPSVPSTCWYPIA